MARKQNWLKALPIVLLGMRDVPNKSGFTLSTAVTGTTLLIPKPFINKSYQGFNSDTVRELASEMFKLDFAKLSEGRLHSV